MTITITAFDCHPITAPDWRVIHAFAGRVKWADPTRFALWPDGAFSAGDLMMVSVLLKSSGPLDEFPNLAA
jgi:hypothetical protein